MATVGTSGVPSQNTVNYDALISTTLMAMSPVLNDNIFKSSAFLAALKLYDGIRMVDGGERIGELLMYEEDDTVKSYRGYDPVLFKPQDGITAAMYEWTEIANPIVISRREERQNSTTARIVDLLGKKILKAEMSIKSSVNKQLVLGTVSSSTFVPGNDAKDLYPLGYFLSKDNTANPSAGGNVGNIARSQAWWRHRTATLASGSKDTGNDFALSVSTLKGLRYGFQRMYNYCARGADGSPPSIILCDQITWETFANSFDDKRQIVGDQAMAQMGFDTIKMGNATAIWDERVPDISSGTEALTYGSAFFINTNFYKLVIDKQTNFIATPFETVGPEQTAKISKILLMAQAIVNNARKNGVCYGISQTITS